MALVDNAWYVDYGDGSTTGYYGVAVWAALTTYDAGVLRRQLAAPAVGSERVFVVVAGHVASGAAEPTWTITRGGKTTDATITWQECTGIAAINGDFGSNTPKWSNASIKGQAITLGQVITNVAGTIVLICTTAGTAGSGAEPSWGAYTTAGATTADNTVTWTNIGVVGNFTGWQAPHVRLGNAYASTWGQNGNSFFVASEHAETQTTANTLTAPGTLASPCSVHCVAKTPVPPTAATTGAMISTTGASAINFGAAGAQAVYYVGIAFLAGNSSNNASITFNVGGAGFLSFKSCGFTLNNTGATSKFNLTPSAGGIVERLLWDTCTWTFGSNVGQQFLSANAAYLGVMRGCTMVFGANVPTTLFVGAGSYLMVEACDLSGLGSGKTLVGASNTSCLVILKDNKLGASVTICGTITSTQQEVYVLRSNSGAVGYDQQVFKYPGTQTIETTIVRTGGATDGTTPISWKIITTANSKWILPYECVPISIWNDTTGSSVTVTIYGIWGGGAVPNNDDIWIDVEYLGSSSTPQGSFVTATKADNLTTNAALASDGSTWGGSTTAFKMTATFTPQMKGPITIYVKAAKLSSTFYIDPRPAINGVTVGKSEILAPGVYVNEVIVGPVGKLVSAQRGSPY